MTDKHLTPQQTMKLDDNQTWWTVRQGKTNFSHFVSAVLQLEMFRELLKVVDQIFSSCSCLMFDSQRSTFNCKRCEKECHEPSCLLYAYVRPGMQHTDRGMDDDSWVWQQLQRPDGDLLHQLDNICCQMCSHSLAYCTTLNNNQSKNQISAFDSTLSAEWF